MLKIALLNAKGGVGKTTITTSVSVRCLDNFDRVGVIDLDPNGGTRTWFEKRRGDEGLVESGAVDMPQLYVGVSDPEDAINACRMDGMDVVVLDGAPGTIDATRLVIGLVDVVLIPEKCSDDDIKSAAMVARMCRDAKTPAVVVINEIPLASDRRPYVVEKAEKIAASVESYGMDAARLHARDTYARAKDGGVGVHEIKGRASSEARKEIDALYEMMLVKLAEGVGK